MIGGERGKDKVFPGKILLAVSIPRVPSVSRPAPARPVARRGVAIVEPVIVRKETRDLPRSVSLWSVSLRPTGLKLTCVES